LAVMGAMVLFAGSAADRAGAQTSSRIELNAASAQDNVQKNIGHQDHGQQASPPSQNPDDTRRASAGRCGNVSVA
jgi:hypothetical protein